MRTSMRRLRRVSVFDGVHELRPAVHLSGPVQEVPERARRESVGPLRPDRERASVALSWRLRSGARVVGGHDNVQHEPTREKEAY